MTRLAELKKKTILKRIFDQFSALVPSKPFTTAPYQSPTTSAIVQNELTGPGYSNTGQTYTPAVGSVPVFQSADEPIRKSPITQWFWNPIYGQPRAVDIAELRGWASTEFVRMCVSTLIEEITCVPWTIQIKDGFEEEPLHQEMEAKVTDFLEHPNGNGESLSFIMKQFLRDLLELDAGVIVKNFNVEGRMAEIVSRDGGSFLKNFDYTGFAPGPEDLDSNGNRIPAYWQYSFVAPNARPIPFLNEEIVYVMLNPRSYSVYGQSNIEVMKSRVLTYLFRSMLWNANFFERNAVPPGIIFLRGADQESKNYLRQHWDGDIRGEDHKVPVITSDSADGTVDFKQFSPSNKDMEFIAGQEWFANIVFAIYKLNPNELGFTGTVGSKNIGESQERITIKKAIKPVMAAIEWAFNTEIIPEFYRLDNEPAITAEVVERTSVEFKFVLDDPTEKKANMEKQTRDLVAGLTTVNEIRAEEGKDPVAWGDQPMSMARSVQPPRQPVGGIPQDAEFAEEPPLSPGISGPPRFPAESRSLGNKPVESGQETQGGVHIPEEDNPVKPPWEIDDITGRDKSLSTKRLSSEAVKEGEANEKQLISLEKNLNATLQVMITQANKKIVQEIKNNKSAFSDMRKKGLGDNFKSIVSKVGSILDETFQQFKSFINADQSTTWEVAQNGAEIQLNMNVTKSTATTEVQNVATENTLELVKNDLEDYKKRITLAITEGVTNKQSVTTISANIRKASGITKERATAIARTETNRVYNQAHLNTYKDSGVVIGKEWVTALDNRVRESHRKVNGQKLKLDQKFNVAGDKVLAPPQGVNCRCSIIPILKGEKI